MAPSPTRRGGGTSRYPWKSPDGDRNWTHALIVATLVAQLPIGHPDARAQNVFQGHASGLQSVSVGFFPVDFRYAGDVDVPNRYDFSRPAYGLVYTRPGLHASAALGSQGGRQDLRLTDISVVTWRGLLKRQAGSTEVYLPAVLAAGYRHLSATADDGGNLEGFNATSLSVGLGGGLTAIGTDRLMFNLRVVPSIGIVTSTLTDAIGVLYEGRGDAELHIAEIFGRYGLTLGYGVRYQIWNVNASAIISDLADKLYDYDGLTHALRAGVNF